MNKLIIIVLLAVFLFACTVAAEEAPQAVDQQKEEIKQQREEFAQEINVAVANFAADMQEHGPEMKEKIEKYTAKLEEIASGIPADGNEDMQKAKETILAISAKLRSLEEHLGTKMLENTVSTVLFAKNNSSNATSAAEKDAEEADFLPILKGIVKAGSIVANVIDGMGSYAGKLQSAANFVSQKVAPFLEKHNLGGLANAAKAVGNGIQKTSNFIAPYEQKLAAKLAPIKNSPIFQGAKRVLNTADALLDVTSLAKNLYNGYKQVKNLPAAIKSGKEVLSKGLDLARKGAKNITKAVSAVSTINKARKVVKSEVDRFKNRRSAKPTNSAKPINSVRRRSTSKPITSRRSARPTTRKSTTKPRTSYSKKRKTSSPINRRSSKPSNRRSSRPRISSKPRSTRPSRRTSRPNTKRRSSTTTSRPKRASSSRPSNKRTSSKPRKSSSSSRPRNTQRRTNTAPRRNKPKQATTATRRSTSPQRRSTTPQRRTNATPKRNTSPQRRSVTPQRRTVSRPTSSTTQRRSTPQRSSPSRSSTSRSRGRALADAVAEFIVENLL